MTENDNIRHYIGSLEATEDIDVMFKHIYDLMLANGGEGSGLNADMLDGYHASDFAPASLKDEIGNSIQEIVINGRSYNKGEPLEIQISDIINDGTTNYAIAQFNTLEKIINNISSSIEGLGTRTEEVEEALDDANNKIHFLDNPNMTNALAALTQNNLKIIDTDGNQKYYLNADSINGLSLQVLTQEMYDNLPNEIKLDPKNIFIINNDIGEAIEEGEYVPPSILQAGINLQFEVDEETHNLVYSIDGRTWKEVIDIVGTENNKGLLYPTRFALVKDAIDEDNLELNQADYPFLLNSDDAKTALSNELQALDEYKIGGITIGSNSITPTSSTTNVDITETLNNYLNSWVQNQTNTNTLRTQLGITSLSQTVNTINSNYEQSSRKSQSITGTGTAINYPSTKATVDYVSTKFNGLQTVVNTQMPKFSETTVDASGVLKGKVYFKKYGRVVNVSGSLHMDVGDEWQISGATNYGSFLSIPSGYEPMTEQYVVTQTSNVHKCFVQMTKVNNNWEASIGRFDMKGTAGSTSYTVPGNYWVGFTHTYVCKE